MESIYRSDGHPKRRIARLGLDVMKGKVSWRQLIKDGISRGEVLPVIVDALFDLVSYGFTTSRTSSGPDALLCSATTMRARIPVRRAATNGVTSAPAWSSPTKAASNAGPASPSATRERWTGIIL